jgi:hypothetical protein
LNYFDIQTTFPGAAFWEFPLLSCWYIMPALSLSLSLPPSIPPSLPIVSTPWLGSETLSTDNCNLFSLRSCVCAIVTRWYFATNWLNHPPWPGTKSLCLVIDLWDDLDSTFHNLLMALNKCYISYVPSCAKHFSWESKHPCSTHASLQPWDLKIKVDSKCNSLMAGPVPAQSAQFWDDSSRVRTPWDMRNFDLKPFWKGFWFELIPAFVLV